MVEHHALLYADLADPVALLRATGATRLARYWPYADGRRAGSRSAPSGSRDYSRADGGLAAAGGGRGARRLRSARHRCLLDVGGGEGRSSPRSRRATPHLQLMLFDLPAVVARRANACAAAGLAGRGSRRIGGDFRTTRCRRAPTSSRWCASCTTTTTQVVLGLLRASGGRCRRAARC